MTGYAASTTVPIDRSRAEIERLVTRYGACQFVSGWNGDMAVIGFTCASRMIRFNLDMPRRDAAAFKATRRHGKSSTQKWEQACRQRWRALCLVIKAKLESVDAGIATFEAAFMANIVLPDGQTVGQFMAPQIAEVYATREMPKLLLGLPAPYQNAKP